MDEKKWKRRNRKVVEGREREQTETKAEHSQRDRNKWTRKSKKEGRGKRKVYMIKIMSELQIKDRSIYS